MTEFLGLYLKALDEELVALHTSLSRQKPVSTQALKIEGLEELEETRSGEGHTASGVGERDYTVHRVPFSLSQAAQSFVLLM